jgi:hypothetical protein
MGSRTYLPTVMKIVRWACIFTAAHDPVIRANLSGPALVAYDVWRSACDGLYAFYDDIINVQP